jgi:CubicO group peptidase (beta-lactamase class C family)
METESMKKNRPARGSHAPGTFWYYNNWDFNVLGTIFEKKTGLKIGEAFYQRIAKSIGMQDFQPNDVYYIGGPISVHPAVQVDFESR